MRKDSRLSFRISPELSNRIDLAVSQSKDAIRDRSEFGTKAIKYYLDFLQNTENEQDSIIKAIIAIANHTNTNTPEIKTLSKIVRAEDRLVAHAHPKYEEILILKEKFSSIVQKEITAKLEKATYNDIEEICEYYRQKYYLEGIEHKKKLMAKKLKSK